MTVKGEKITTRKFVGIVIGLIAIVMLMIPTVYQFTNDVTKHQLMEKFWLVFLIAVILSFVSQYLIGAFEWRWKNHKKN